MADIILEQSSGIDQTNMDGGAFNNFAAGNRDGIMKNVLNECRVFEASSNVIGIDSGEFMLHGIRIKRTEQTTFTLTSTPVTPVRYQIIAEIDVNQSDSHINFNMTLRTISSLRQDELYQLGYGVYQVEVMRFTHTPNGVTDIVRMIDVITGGSEGLANITVGKTITNTLDPGMEAEVSVESRYDIGQARYVTDFVFSIPKGDKGDVGLKGDKGDVGLKGDKGDVGLKGDKGDVGLKGDKGDVGAASNLSIGVVVKGTHASAILTGQSPNQVLDLVLPKGDKGDVGAGVGGTISDTILYTTSMDDGETIELTYRELNEESYQGRIMSIYPSTYTQVCRHPIHREKGIIPFKYMKGFLDYGTIPSNTKSKYEKLANGNYLLTYFMGQTIWDRYLREPYSSSPLTWEQFYAKYTLFYVQIELYSNHGRVGGELGTQPTLKRKLDSTYEFVASTENMIVRRVMFAKDHIEYEINMDDWEQCGMYTSFYVGDSSASSATINLQVTPPPGTVQSNDGKPVVIKKFATRYFPGEDNGFYSMLNTTGSTVGKFWEPYKYTFQTDHKGEFRNQIAGEFRDSYNKESATIKIWNGDKWINTNSLVILPDPTSYHDPISNKIVLVPKYVNLDYSSSLESQLTKIYTDRLLNLACNDATHQAYSHPAYIAEWLSSGQNLTKEQMQKIYEEIDYLVMSQGSGVDIIIGLDEMYRSPVNMLGRFKYTSNKGTFTEDILLSYCKVYDRYSIENEIVEYDEYTNRKQNTSPDVKIVDLALDFGAMKISRGIFSVHIAPISGSGEIISSIDSIKIGYSTVGGTHQGTHQGMQKFANESEQNIIVDMSYRILQTLTGIPSPIQTQKMSRIIPKTRTLKEWLEVIENERHKRYESIVTTTTE